MREFHLTFNSLDQLCNKDENHIICQNSNVLSKHILFPTAYLLRIYIHHAANTQMHRKLSTTKSNQISTSFPHTDWKQLFNGASNALKRTCAMVQVIQRISVRNRVLLHIIWRLRKVQESLLKSIDLKKNRKITIILYNSGKYYCSLTLLKKFQSVTIILYYYCVFQTLKQYTIHNQKILWTLSTI